MAETPIASYVFTLVEAVAFAAVLHLCIQRNWKKPYKLILSALYAYTVINISNELSFPHVVKASIVFIFLIVFCFALYRAKVYIN